MCLSPISVRNEKRIFKKDYEFVNVPCGKCLECMQARVNDWWIRLRNELKTCANAYFITFTYDNENLPFTEDGEITLDYKDLQNLWKKVRKHYVYKKKNPKTGRMKSYYDKVPKIKYFAVGEYGSRTDRPHFHAIVFNCDPLVLDSKWTKGTIHVGEVTDASVKYTLKYCSKKFLENFYKSNTRQPEKAMMSKGLGLSFLTPQMKKYYQDDVSRPVVIEDGQKVGLPRYYREKLFTDAQKKERNEVLLPQAEEKNQRYLNPLFRQIVEDKYRKSIKKLLNSD